MLSLIHIYITAVLKKILKPNMSFNRHETDRRKEQAKSEIKPITLKIKKGEFIIKRGDTIEKWHILALRGLEQERIHDRSWDKTIFMGLFFFIFVVVLGKMSSVLFKNVKFEIKDIMAIAVIVFLEIFFAKIFFYVSTEGLREKFPSIPVAFYYYAVPVASAAFMIRLMLSKEIAFVFAAFNAILYGMLLEFNLHATVFTLITSITAVVSSSYIKTRWSIYRTGILVAFVSVLTIVCISLLSPEEFALDGFGDFSYRSFNWMIFAGGFNGVLTSILVIGIVPIFEYLFAYTTDMTLLELSSFEHPLMKNMIANASGTYNHSARMAILAEAAAEGIGCLLYTSRCV